MSTFWKKKHEENKKTFEEWEAKLKESGFRDIEYRVDGEPADYLVGPNPMDFVRAGTKRIEASTNYYECARQFRWWLRENGEERGAVRVWDLHAEGKSIMEIVNTLDEKRWFVTKTINRIKRDMRRRVREGLEPFDPDSQEPR